MGQSVNHDPSDPGAEIPEAEARAISHALWEAAVEDRILSRSSDGQPSEVASIDHRKGHCHPNVSEKVFLSKLNRIPRELLKEFAEGASLRPCRDALLAEGFEWRLGSGAMMFVHPWQFNRAMAVLGNTELHPDHVVFTQSVEYLVAEVLEPYNTWMKSRSPLDMEAVSHTIISSSSYDPRGDTDAEGDGGRASGLSHGELEALPTPVVSVVNTFWTLVPPDQSSAVTVSDTDVYNSGNNPRRMPVSDMY